MFADRADAGRRLAVLLEGYRDRDPVVLALPRGGVPVAYEVARALGAPLDVLVARKIGAPGQEEFGVGALAQGGVVYLDADLVRRLGVTRDYLAAVTRREGAEMVRRERAYRGDRPPLDVAGRTVLLVDDGLATGATARAAVRSLRQRAPREIVVAVPVGSADTLRAVGAEVDAVVCVETPDDFRAVGLWYADFEQTADAEVVALLARAAAERGASPPRPAAGLR
ncbi:MAG: phosphoribosyltransferase [Myxococcaceae bacterium]|nr:phosphoribosyltransferase [Myxococcaceae bacterium]